MQLINRHLNYFNADEVSKCKLFVLTLVGPVRLWLNALLGGSIESWTDFYQTFFAHFTAQKRQLVTVCALSRIIQGKKERKSSKVLNDGYSRTTFCGITHSY